VRFCMCARCFGNELRPRYQRLSSLPIVAGRSLLTPWQLVGLGPCGQRGISPTGFAVLPVCVGVAMLKYRLYEIDRIISRVISYAIITAVLAGVFAGARSPGHRGTPDQDPGRGGGRHTGRRGAVQPAAQAGPARRRPPLRPGALQRPGDRGRVHRSVAPDRRPRHGTRGSARRDDRRVPRLVRAVLEADRPVLHDAPWRCRRWRWRSRRSPPSWPTRARAEAAGKMVRACWASCWCRPERR